MTVKRLTASLEPNENLAFYPKIGCKVYLQNELVNTALYFNEYADLKCACEMLIKFTSTVLLKTWFGSSTDK